MDLVGSKEKAGEPSAILMVFESLFVSDLHALKRLPRLKRIMKLIISLVLISFSLENSAWAVTQDYKKIFKKSLKSKRLKYQNFGISLYKYNSAKGAWLPVLRSNANKSFTPASISKVITAASLLELHGLSKKIETALYAESKPTAKVFNKAIYIKGGGDPSLVSEKMWLLVNELRKWGVKKITGDLIFDDSVFDDKILDGDRSKWNQRAYNAPVSGLALNWNSVRVRFLSPDPLIAVSDPYNPYFDLRLKKNLRKSSQVELRPAKDKEVLSVFYGRDAIEDERSIYRRITKPREVFQAQFRQTLKEAGIQHTGNLKWAKMPEGLIKIGFIESEHIFRLLNLMMKFSNNFIADTLTKFSFHEQTGQQGTYQGGLSLIESTLNKITPFRDQLVFKSASGLSRDNKISPEDMTRLLIKLQSKYYYPEFLSSFPVSCVDGTLKKRICKKTNLVRAKTGLLAGVSSLAGYAQSANGLDKYIFTFVYNGRNGDQFNARDAYDDFLESIL